MEHYGTLVVAGLSDHTLKLTPVVIFACTEVHVVQAGRGQHERHLHQDRDASAGPHTIQMLLHSTAT